MAIPITVRDYNRQTIKLGDTTAKPYVSSISSIDVQVMVDAYNTN